jgi:adenylate kinase
VIVLLFGPPGCGKGTQSRYIVEHLQIPAISTGEMLRAACQSGSPIGRAVVAILAKGALVGDDIVNQIVIERLGQPDCAGGFLLDGYPRTLAQGVFLHDFFRQRGLPEPKIVHLDVPSSVLVDRLCSRRQCPKCLRIYNVKTQPPRVQGVCNGDGEALITRKDDCEETVQERFRTYEQLTGPLIDFYRNGDYHRVDGTGGPDQIWLEVREMLQPVLVPVESAWNRRERTEQEQMSG